MTGTSIYRRHRDLFWSLIPSVFVVFLSSREAISFDSLSPVVPISILIAVVTGVAGLFVVYQKYDSVIAKSKNQEKRSLIKSVFMYPLVSSILGVLFIISANGIQLWRLGISSAPILKLVASIGDGLIIFLIIYSLISFSEAVSFVYRVIEGQAT